MEVAATTSSAPYWTLLTDQLWVEQPGDITRSRAPGRLPAGRCELFVRPWRQDRALSTKARRQHEALDTASSGGYQTSDHRGVRGGRLRCGPDRRRASRRR